MLAWQVGDTRFIADAGGAIFARSAGREAAAGVAVVDDAAPARARRSRSAGELDAVDARRRDPPREPHPDRHRQHGDQPQVAVTDRDGFVADRARAAGPQSSASTARPPARPT